MNEMIEILNSISPLGKVEQEALEKICTRKIMKKLQSNLLYQFHHEDIPHGQCLET